MDPLKYREVEDELGLPEGGSGIEEHNHPYLSRLDNLTCFFVEYDV